MRSGQGGYRLRTHGGRVPVPWLIGTAAGRCSSISPSAAFDLTGGESRFQPASPARPRLPLDLFVVAVAGALRHHGRIRAAHRTRRDAAALVLGYQQSHRTLASREEILDDARTFREKKLPCDTLIYLGTGFCPSGWNTDNG